MKNLKILSMDFGNNYIVKRMQSKKELLSNILLMQEYDMILLQGKNVTNMIQTSDIVGNRYQTKVMSKNLMSIWKDQYHCFTSSTLLETVDQNIIYFDNRPIACLNINCKYPNNFYDVLDCLDAYSRSDSVSYVASRIITGRFPKEIDPNEFCDAFDLKDVSTIVAQNAHMKYNQKILRHLFISRNLECKSIQKLIGLTEVSKIGEAYPLEATITYRK